MRALIILVLLLSLCPLALAQNKAQLKAPEAKPPIEQFEMRTYYLLHLLKGPNRDQDSATAAAIQTAHLAHLDRLYYAKKLVMAGPILTKQVPGGTDLMGIAVLVAPSADSARVWAEADPAVRAGRLRVLILPWMSARGVCLP